MTKFVLDFIPFVRGRLALALILGGLGLVFLGGVVSAYLRPPTVEPVPDAVTRSRFQATAPWAADREREAS